jgi:hypothetical protein
MSQVTAIRGSVQDRGGAVLVQCVYPFALTRFLLDRLIFNPKLVGQPGRGCGCVVSWPGRPCFSDSFSIWD